MYAEPHGLGNGNSLSQALLWLQELLLGRLGTAMAVLALAAIGFGMLQGRLSWRDGARVLSGCFILFGAPMIAAAIADLATSDSGALEATVQMPPALPSPIPDTPASDSDPYAGASVPL